MKTSIILVNYNTKDLTSKCIDSIINKTKENSYEIIVVDNASIDKSTEFIDRKYKPILKDRLKIIKNKKNYGFSRANNQGISKAGGKYILLLNTDTLLQNDIVSYLVGWMDAHRIAGAVTPSLRNSDGSLQGSGGYFPTIVRVFAWMMFIDDLPLIDLLIKPFHPLHNLSLYKGTALYKNRRQLDWITGAVMFIRRSALDEVGNFDENYFMYTEDTDLCYRLKSKGWQIWYLPEMSVIHYGGASSTRDFPIIMEYKSIKYFYRKFMPKWQYPLLRLLLKKGAVLRMVLHGLFRGKEAFATYAKAYKVA